MRTSASGRTGSSSRGRSSRSSTGCSISSARPRRTSSWPRTGTRASSASASRLQGSLILSEDAVRRRAERLARAPFARRLRPGDGVAAALGNTDEHVALREAAAALELYFVPLNPKLTAREADDLVARARALRVDPTELDGPPRSLREGAIGATILFTSG